MPESVVLLHGFSGTGRAWDDVAARLEREGYRPLAPDLPGHGRAAEYERPITFSGCVGYVLAQAPERFALCGYSLGGRVALHVALNAPERVSRLVLVSSGAGIDDAAERAERRRADRRLADELESVPFDDFIERWRTQPLFAEEPPEVGRLAREDQRRNRPARLSALTLPVTVVVGEPDARYQELGRRMAETIGGAELVTIAGGHGLVLENPEAVAGVLLKRPDAEAGGEG